MMFSPMFLVFLTMLYSPTVTTKSTKTPTPGSLFATCDNEMEVFLDGVKYTDAAMKHWEKTSEVSIPPHTDVIAISCKDTGYTEGFVASTTTGIVTDGSWKCSSVKEDNWMMSDFDDSDWKSADTSRGTNVAPKQYNWGLRANIDNNAHWIWATGYPTKTTEAYCRKSLVPGSTSTMSSTTMTFTTTTSTTTTTIPTSTTMTSTTTTTTSDTTKAGCIDTGCKKTGLAEDVEAECVYLKNVNWTSISHIYNVSTPWKEGLCKGAHFDEDCCKCLPRLPVGCVDVKDACKNAFGGFGVCKNYVKDDMSAIDFEQGSKKDLCNAVKPDCCECFSLKKTKTTKP